MGMYNEVFKKCPECGARMEVQIPQIVFGFGGFDLDDPSTYKNLSADERNDLFDGIKDKTFFCEKCHSPSQSLVVECPDCKAILQISSNKKIVFVMHRT